MTEPKDVGTTDDFMPLDGWDHVELWVGNAKQAAYYYEHAFGFHRTAYAGPETGVRDRASYVLEQNEIRLVLTSAAAERQRDRPPCIRARRRREGHRAARPRRRPRLPRGSRARGARSAPSRTSIEDDFGEVELATIATYGDVVHTFVGRGGYEGAYLPGYVAQPSANGSGDGRGAARDRPHRRQRRARPAWTTGSRSTSRCSG